MGHNHLCYYSILTLNLLATSKSALGACQSDQIYYIKHLYSGLTVDASNTTILTIEVFDGSENQQFTFTCASQAPGIFYIVHASTGMVLDILSNHSPQYITLNNLEGFLTQQWFLNADGRITNSAGTGRTLDVHKGVFVPGGLLKIYPENDTPAQYFFIEEKV